MGSWISRICLVGCAFVAACSHANDAGWEEYVEAPVTEQASSAIEGDDGRAAAIATTSGEVEASGDAVCSEDYVSATCPNTTVTVSGWPKTLLSGVYYSTTGWKGGDQIGPGLANTWVVLSLTKRGSTGDPDLHVKKNGVVSDSVYDCRPWTASNPEFCAFFLENDSDYLTWGIYVYTAGPTVDLTATATRCDGTVYTGPKSFEDSGANSPPAMKCCACIDGFEAMNGQCCREPEPCTDASECDSGFCVDGYCCDTACSGSCERCDLPAAPGICAAVPAGSPGVPACGNYVCDGVSGSCPASCFDDAGCATGLICKAGGCIAKADDGSACDEDRECASGHCAEGVCCNSACTGACESCNLPGSIGSCKLVAAGGEGEGCGLYRCSGKSPDCPDKCEIDGHCLASAYCAFGSCELKAANGAACSADEQCQSGHCVDNTCCETACDGQCERCDAEGMAGLCTPVVGKPVGERPACADDGSSCGGSCDGVNTASCTYPGATVACGAASCVAGVATEAGRCDGEGSCQAKTQVCAPYACGDDACLASCTGAADCAASAICRKGVCVGILERGSPCVADGECKSGFCSDGVCCNSACEGECDACNLPGSVGTCTAKVGGECSGGAGGNQDDDGAEPFVASEDDGGCGCRVAGAPTGRGPHLLSLLLGLAFVGRRRRRALS